MSFIIVLSMLATVPMALIWPHVGILSWFWIGYMNPHRLAWGAIASLPFAATVAAATLLGWLISREPKRIPVTPVTVLMFLLTLWITWTSYNAIVPEAAWGKWDQTVKIFLMTFVTLALINSRERLHALVWVIVVSLGFYAVKGGAFTLLTGGQFHVFGPPKSFISDNNALAMALVMTLPFMRYLQLQSGRRLVRHGMTGLMALTVFSAIGSQSRGAFLALAVVAFAILIKSRWRLQIGAFLLALGMVAIWFVPEQWVERMQSIERFEEDQSAQARLNAWSFAWEIAKRRPLRGGGFDVYQDEQLYLSLVPEAGVAHNFHSIYFEALGQHGFVGLAIFLALGFAAWRAFARTIKGAKAHADLKWAEDLARMGQASLMGYFSAGAFLNLAFFDLYYTIVAIGVVSMLLVEREVAARAAGEGVRGRRYTAAPARARWGTNERHA